MAKKVVPAEVRTAVGNALTPESLASWWEAKTRWFEHRSPREAWEAGERQKVMDFIAAAKKRDAT